MATLGYISPSKMQEYRQTVLHFAKGAPELKCIRSHFLSDSTGVCDLTGAKEQSEIFVLANRSHQTLKVSPKGMQIVANIIEISDADQWYQHLREQKKAEKERQQEEAEKLEEKRKASRVVVFKRRANR